MPTLPKTNKKKTEKIKEDPFDTISDYLSPPQEPPIITAGEEQPIPIITAEEEQPISPDEELYFTSDLGERVYPVDKDPEKNYGGVDAPSFNLPPLIASEEEMQSMSPAMKDFYNQALESSGAEAPEQPSVYPYEFMQPDQDIHQPEYGPDGKLLPGFTNKDLKKRVGEDEFTTISKYREEKDYWNQPFWPATKGILKEIDSWETGVKFSRLIYGAMADFVDWPYDMLAEFMNAALTKSSLDKSVGTFKVDNFRNVLHSIGYTYNKETDGEIELDEPILYHMADFIGMGWAIYPMQTVSALRLSGTLSTQFFSESSAKLAKRTWLGKKINFQTLRNKIANKLPFLKPIPVSAYRPTIKSSFDAFKTSVA